MTIARLTEVLTLSNTQIAIEAARKRLDVVGIFMVMGLTAFGGVLRDMVCNEIPCAFRDHQPYAVCSFAGGWVMIAVQTAGAPQWLGLVSAAATATLLRMLALQQGWSLPGWRAGDSGHH